MSLYELNTHKYIILFMFIIYTYIILSIYLEKNT